MKDSSELYQLFVVVKKWWWLLLLASGVAATAAYVFTPRLVPQYAASTTLIVGQSTISDQPDASQLRMGEQLAYTYAQIAVRQPILQSVVDSLNLPYSWQELQSMVQAVPVLDTPLLQITVQSQDGEEARLIANEIATRMTQLTENPAEKQGEAEDRQLILKSIVNSQDRIERWLPRIADMEDKIAAAYTTELALSLQNDLLGLERQMAEWENNVTRLLALLQGPRQANYVAIVEQAYPYAISEFSRVTTNTISASIAGLLLSLGLVFLIEFLDDSLKSAAELQSSLDLQPLGEIRLLPGRGREQKLILHQDPLSAFTEAYRKVRNHIQFAAAEKSTSFILVTSAAPNEGKSVTVANLGLAMAQAGLRTIVVDANLRDPVQHEIFGIAGDYGLTELFQASDLDVAEVVVPGPVTNLYILPSGSLFRVPVHKSKSRFVFKRVKEPAREPARELAVAGSPANSPSLPLAPSNLENGAAPHLSNFSATALPPSPVELLGSPHMEQVLAKLAKVADIVLFDGPAVIAVTDASVLARRMDHVVLVVEAGKTARKRAQQAVTLLRQVEANLLGGVLNKTLK